MSKPIDLLKLSWLVFSLVSVGFLISYGVTSYQNRVVDKPSWMLCETDKGFKKPQYIKFHNTKKVIYNIYQQRWVEDIGTKTKRSLETWSYGNFSRWSLSISYKASSTSYSN